MIIQSFNLVHIIFLLCQPILIVLCYFLFRNRSYKFKRYMFMGVAIFNFIYFIVYKLWLYLDPAFHFNIWNELPLQLCNINIILLFFAMLFDNKTLMSFVAVIGSVGAVMAMAFPDVNFVGVPFFSLRCIGFYGTHMIIFVSSISLMTLGMYKPTFKSIPLLLLVITIIATVIFSFNVIMRVTQVYPECNYFYTYGMPGNAIFDLFWKLIPIPLLTLLPSLLILLAYISLLIGITKLIEIFKKKNNKSVNEA